MPNRVRSVYAYELHGHDASGPLDYDTYFQRLSELPVPDRQYVRPRSSEIVAVPEVRRVSDSVFVLRLVSGRAGELPLLYDPETGIERTARVRQGELAIQFSWLLVDVSERLVVQERRRPGVPLGDAVRGLVGIGRNHGLADNPTLSFHPLVASGFAAEIDELYRVKSATMVLARPNMSFKDAANSLISKAAADSNAGAVTLGAKARPQESLAKDAGIISEIKDMTSTSFSPLRSAQVVGRRADESKDRTVSTRNHARRYDIELSDYAGQEEESQAVLQGSIDYLAKLREERRDATEPRTASATELRPEAQA